MSEKKNRSGRAATQVGAVKYETVNEFTRRMTEDALAAYRAARERIAESVAEMAALEQVISAFHASRGDNGIWVRVMSAKPQAAAGSSRRTGRR